MAGSFDDSGAAAYVSVSAGGTGAMGTGAHTIVCLYQYNDGSTFHKEAAVTGYATATLTRELLFTGADLFGPSDFSSGVPVTGIASGDWFVFALTKAAGSATYRCHWWEYNASGTGTMTHTTATGAANHGDGSAITTWRIGNGDTKTNGSIAVVGLWTSALSDAQLDSLVSIHLSAWAALSPQALISLQNWNGSTGCTDVVGTSSQQSITGTVGAGSNPPSFDFSTSSGVTGTLAETGDNDIVSASGVLGYSGTLARTEANDTATASGTSTPPGISGSLARAQANNTSAAAGVLGYAGTLAKSQGNNTAAAGGTVAGPGSNTGTVAVTQANDVSAAAGVLGYLGALARQQANNTAAAAGLVANPITGTLARVQADNTVTAVGAITGPGVPIAPPERTYAVPGELRVYSVPAESRVTIIPAESRVLEVLP